MRIGRAWQVAVVLLFSVISVLAQKEEKVSPQPEWVISVEDMKIRIESMQLMFLVRDGNGNLIQNLKASDFQLTENGEVKQISVVQQRDIPLNACIMVDTSWSIGWLVDNVVKTASQFFQGLTKDKTSVVYFSERPRVVRDWSTQIDDVPFRNVKLEGRTALYDSLLWVMNQHFKDVYGKKLVFLITDGIDNASRASIQEVFKTAREKGIVVYAIMYTNPVIQNLRQRLLVGKSIRGISKPLERIITLQNAFIESTLRHGGRTIFSNSFADMENVYRGVVDETKSQYVLTFPIPKQEVDTRDIRFVIKPEIPGRILVQVGH
ncbi:MAG TPA: VWA domain-containing protein [Acidobacteriota bacterium]|jgi:VWFA-related protein